MEPTEQGEQERQDDMERMISGHPTGGRDAPPPAGTTTREKGVDHAPDDQEGDADSPDQE